MFFHAHQSSQMIPRNKDTGTGSNNQTPHLAKSFATNGPVKNNHPSTKSTLLIFCMIGERYAKCRWFLKTAVACCCRIMPTPCNIKNVNGPAKGLETENVVNDAEAWMNPDNAKATPSCIRRAGWLLLSRPKYWISARDGSLNPNLKRTCKSEQVQSHGIHLKVEVS